MVRIIAGAHHHKMGLVAGGGEETSASSKGDGEEDFEIAYLVMLHHRCGNGEGDSDGRDVGHKIGQ